MCHLNKSKLMEPESRTVGHQEPEGGWGREVDDGPGWHQLEEGYVLGIKCPGFLGRRYHPGVIPGGSDPGNCHLKTIF